MPKNLITILGVLIALLPFISIPGFLKTPLYFIFGTLIALAGYFVSHPKHNVFLKQQPRRQKKIEPQKNVFVSPNMNEKTLGEFKTEVKQ